MLHAFLDGELAGVHEEVLFNKLSSSSELRSEMQDQLAIRKAVQHDAEAFNPPSAATAAVFGALGFSIPPPLPVVAATSTSLSQRLWMSGASAVTAVAIAVLLYMQFPALLQQSAGPAERVVSSPPFTVMIEETPALSDINITAPAARSVIASAIPAAAAAELRDVDVRSLGFQPCKALPASEIALRDPERLPSREVYFYDLISAPEGVSFYARNVALRSDPAPKTVSQSESWFRNVNLGLMYALSDYHSIGIEGGQEAFPQHFSGVEYGVAKHWEQNPLKFWATGVYQFNGEALLSHVYPFAQVQLGGVFQLGGLARTTIGLKFKPFDGIAIMVGAEGSVLMYRFQNAWFRTDKLGMTYGVAYEF
jgi:hypothetical protein